MKKIVTTLLVILVTLFLLKSNIKSLETNKKTGEYFHRIYFEHLNSKNINELFDGLIGTVIEVEIKTKYLTKSYRFNTAMINNIERSLNEKVIKDLEEMNDKELLALYKVSGFNISRIDVLCNEETLKIIKERANE